MSSTPKSFQVTEPADKRHSRVEYDMNPVLLTLLPAWKYIAALTVAAFVIAALLAKFVMVKQYRAEAILRPVSQLMPSGVGSASSNPVGGLSSALLGNTYEYRPLAGDHDDHAEFRLQPRDGPAAPSAG